MMILVTITIWIIGVLLAIFITLGFILTFKAMRNAGNNNQEEKCLTIRGRIRRMLVLVGQKTPCLNQGYER